MHNILLKHNFINTIHHSEMFQPSMGHPQGVQLIHFRRKVNKMSHEM
jgi:hypothetical protein